MALMDLSQISGTAVEETNIRGESAEYFNGLLKSFEIDGAKKNVSLKEYFRQINASKELKSYADNLKGLFFSLKEEGKNNEPIRIIPLSPDEQKRAKEAGDKEAVYGILDGHTRYGIAKYLGWNQIDVNVVNNGENLTPAQRIGMSVQANTKTPLTWKESKAIATRLSKMQGHDPKTGNPLWWAQNGKQDPKTGKFDHMAGDPKPMSNVEIARIMGVSEVSVRRYLKYDPDKKQKAVKPATEKGEKTYVTIDMEHHKFKWLDGSKDLVKSITTKMNEVSFSGGKEDAEKIRKTAETIDFDAPEIKRTLDTFDALTQLQNLCMQAKAYMQENDLIKFYIAERRIKESSESRGLEYHAPKVRDEIKAKEAAKKAAEKEAREKAKAEAKAKKEEEEKKNEKIKGLNGKIVKMKSSYKPANDPF